MGPRALGAGPGQIRGGVLGVWRALQPSMLKKVADRVRRNATKVVELKGGTSEIPTMGK